MPHSRIMPGAFNFQMTAFLSSHFSFVLKRSGFRQNNLEKFNLKLNLLLETLIAKTVLF